MIGISVAVAILMNRIKAKICTPDWQCLDWSPCVTDGAGGYRQIRECRDQNKCGVSGLPPPSENWKPEIKSCTPPPPTDTFKIELVLDVIPEPNFDAQPNEKRIVWQIFLGNPTSQPVNADAIITINGVIRGEPYVALGDIPVGMPFSQMGIGGFRSAYPGETYIICMKPRTSTVWSEQCKTVVVT